GALEHRAHRATRDDPGARRRGLQQHTAGAVMTDDLVRDRRARERHLHQPTARRFHRLAHRFADLVRLAGRDADVPVPVAHGDERVETEPPAAFHHLGHAIDRDDVFNEPVALTLTLTPVTSLATAPPAATATPPAPAAPPPPAAPTT